MNRNLVIVLAGGLLIAVLVAVIVQAGMKGKSKPTVVEEAPKVAIAVAVKPLPAGTKIDDTNVRWQDWPQNGVFPGAYVRKGDEKPSEVIKGKLRRPLKPNEPVIESAIIGANELAYLPAVLEDGMRAVTIDITATKGVAGFVGPGDRVDVMLIYSDQIRYTGKNSQIIDAMLKREIKKSAIETILQNVKVLAVDQSVKRDEEKGPKIGKTVTLEVNMRDAEILMLARSIGNLTLSLRKLGDDKFYVRDYDIVTDERITHVDEELEEKIISKMEKASGQQGDIVRIYNGGAVSQVPVGP